MGNQKLKLVGGEAGLAVVDPKRLAQDANLGGIGLDWLTVPEDLGVVGRRAWQHLHSTFRDEPTRFREADRVAVTSYCQAVEVTALAAQAVRDGGVLVPGRSKSDGENRLVRAPAWSMWREGSTQVRVWSNDLGLTPSSRYRMKIPEPRVGGDEGNPFAAPPG